jgi:hypothetical protein
MTYQRKTTNRKPTVRKQCAYCGQSYPKPGLWKHMESCRRIRALIAEREKEQAA